MKDMILMLNNYNMFDSTYMDLDPFLLTLHSQQVVINSLFEFSYSVIINAIHVKYYIFHEWNIHYLNLMDEYLGSSFPNVFPAMEVLGGIKGPTGIGEALGGILVIGMLVSGALLSRIKQNPDREDSITPVNLIGFYEDCVEDGDHRFPTVVIYDQYDLSGKSLHKILFKDMDRTYPDGLAVCRITPPNAQPIVAGCFVMSYEEDWRFVETFSEEWMESHRQLSYIVQEVNIPIVDGMPYGSLFYHKFGVWVPVSDAGKRDIVLNKDKYFVMCGTELPQFTNVPAGQLGEPHVELLHVPTYLSSRVEIHVTNTNFALFEE